MDNCLLHGLVTILQRTGSPLFRALQYLLRVGGSAFWEGGRDPLPRPGQPIRNRFLHLVEAVADHPGAAWWSRNRPTTWPKCQEQVGCQVCLHLG